MHNCGNCNCEPMLKFSIKNYYNKININKSMQIGKLIYRPISECRGLLLDVCFHIVGLCFLKLLFGFFDVDVQKNNLLCFSTLRHFLRIWFVYSN